ncbi:hypothetical protein DFQ01_105212 [Paenibacillus cellulosilyticus]|uniref:Uncharacterized protein n=1 Tax=Paenibacillus cellulosilyticus TaxID=375489 RepID=A0A2V2YVQ4_9BACL|nr:hypothetical protein [Paenibacillus cellulosilyticus]PWW05228.1 hypothetical protein DFQ01_105212 [Paenibacillus cellulosilyticus]QKS43553.1 hypothetical protein HUB94_03205 [Paenibacillus cellulosilyticus]
MSVKQKQIILLSTLVALMIVVVVVAVVIPLRSHKDSIEDSTVAAATTDFSSSELEPGYDMPLLPNRLLESRLYDAPSWPESSSMIVVNDSAQLRAAGISRYGRLEIISQPGELTKRDGGPTKYNGTYTVQYVDASGKTHKLPDQVKQVLRQLPEPAAVMKVVPLGDTDVLLFLPRYYRFAQGYDAIYTTYAYAITANEEAFPLEFVYNEKGSGLKVMDSFLFDMNGPIESAGTALSAQTVIMGERYEIGWTLDVDKHQLLAKELKDRTEEYAKLDDITSRASKHIEQAFGLTEVDYPDGKLPEDKLRELFTDQAWSNPGFQFLREDFVKQEQRTGNTNRAFAWNPIDAAYTSPDTIRFTFTINLWYAIGLAGHLEVELKQQNGQWIIADFGTLETEKLDDPNAPYSGLLMEDPLD